MPKIDTSEIYEHDSLWNKQRWLSCENNQPKFRQGSLTLTLLKRSWLAPRVSIIGVGVNILEISYQIFIDVQKKKTAI